MNILIKGREMPKVCADCPFRDDPGYYNYEHCKALGKIFNECRLDIDPFEEKLNDCPLVEVVTCGECKHYDEDGWGYGNCQRPFVDYLRTAEYDFCSYGERKTEQTKVCDDCIYVEGSQWCEKCDGEPKHWAKGE